MQSKFWYVTNLQFLLKILVSYMTIVLNPIKIRLMDSLRQLARAPLPPKIKTDWKQQEADSSSKAPEPKKNEIKRSYRIYKWEQPNYKYIDLLFRSIAYNSKLLPTLFTRADATQQRNIAKSVKQARVLGLLPFVHKDYDNSRV